jgi:hypothetical protein
MEGKQENGRKTHKNSKEGDKGRDGYEREENTPEALGDNSERKLRIIAA